MEVNEIIEIMDKPRSNSRVAQYRIIYKLATGQEWKKCFCGSGFDIFFKTCKNYAEALKKQNNLN